MLISTLLRYFKNRSATELPLLVQTVVVLCGEQVRSDILWLIPETGVLFERQLKVMPMGASVDMSDWFRKKTGSSSLFLCVCTQASPVER